MSLQYHTSFSKKKGSNWFFGGRGGSGQSLGTGSFGGVLPTTSQINIKTKNGLSVNQVDYTNFKVLPRTTFYQLNSLAFDNNSGYTGITNRDFIVSPYYREDHFYNFYVTSGENVSGFDSPSGLRFVFCPDEPETFLYPSGISSGDSVIFLPKDGYYRNLTPKVVEHFLMGEMEEDVFGSGKNFELTVGINSDEILTVTGQSGDHLLLSGIASGYHPVGTRLVSRNTLHPAPTGETGYAQEFQVLIQNNGDGNSRFYVAGSGVTGGCHLGGTFTGSGYTFFETPVIDVYRGFNYYFNQHHASNHDEYIMFSYTSGGEHNAGERISGKYEVEQAGSNFCFNNYCNYHCPDESTLMVPIEMESGDKIYYYASGTAGIGGTGYLNVMVSGDGGR